QWRRRTHAVRADSHNPRLPPKARHPLAPNPGGRNLATGRGYQPCPAVPRGRQMIATTLVFKRFWAFQGGSRPAPEPKVGGSNPPWRANDSGHLGGGIEDR